MVENSTLDVAGSLGCNFCGEPPPDDIMFMPPPPMHRNYCRSFLCEDSKLEAQEEVPQDMDGRIIALLIAFLTISAIFLIYLVSLAKARVFKTNHMTTPHSQPNKNRSLTESIANSGAHLTDYSNPDKNLTSPIISDHATHKKTSIPSNYWAQPGSIIGRTVRRIPNEYEFPSSRTNSTGTSSAVYADMNNLHTYAEVREILDQNEQFQTSSNSSVMLSDFNYDNAMHIPNFHTPQRAQIIITSNNQGVNPSLINNRERVHII